MVPERDARQQPIPIRVARRSSSLPWGIVKDRGRGADGFSPARAVEQAALGADRKGPAGAPDAGQTVATVGHSTAARRPPTWSTSRVRPHRW
jgi:hypothetical protein